MPERDDGVEAARRRVVQLQFRRMIDDDPALRRLAAVTRYPRMRLESTGVLGLSALILAFLRDNIVVAAMVGLIVVTGHLLVVYLLAHKDESGALLVLRVVRGLCGLTIFLLVVAAVTTSEQAVVDPPPVPMGVHGWADPSAAASVPAGQSSGQNENQQLAGQAGSSTNAP
jgi:hypothetical protein